MPRPPDIGDLGKLNFIANYFLAGCTPPIFLFLQFAKAPAKDLALLFLLPDLVDIGQAIFDPKQGRKRKPGRHGRKRRRRPGIPDPSDAIGQKVRGVINPTNMLDFGPVNKAFRIVNFFERIAFTAAVLEGVTDIGYEGLLGVVSTDPYHCTEFKRLIRKDATSQLAGGVGPPIWPIACETVEHTSGFTSSDFSCSCIDEPFHVHYRAQIMNTSATVEMYVDIGLESVGSHVKALSRQATLAPGETVWLDVNAEFDALEPCGWGVGNRFNNPLVLRSEVVAFSKSGIPWPF